MRLDSHKSHHTDCINLYWRVWSQFPSKLPPLGSAQQPGQQPGQGPFIKTNDFSFR